MSILASEAALFDFFRTRASGPSLTSGSFTLTLEGYSALQIRSSLSMFTPADQAVLAAYIEALLRGVTSTSGLWVLFGPYRNEFALRVYVCCLDFSTISTLVPFLPCRFPPPPLSPHSALLTELQLTRPTASWREHVGLPPGRPDR